MAWCSVCDGRHGTDASCPGPLEATDAERHGWRVNVDTPQGMRAIGVLIAPAGDLWRARVLTFPRQLWLVPGGGPTMKFSGQSAEAAEARAIAFVREHCEAKGFAIRQDVARPEVVAAVAAAGSGSPARRKLCFLPLMFGERSPNLPGGTADMSERGLFVMTETPLAENSAVRLLLQLDDEPLAMQGDVRWSRVSYQVGRAPGMGVELAAPPERYREYVRELQ